MKQLYLLLCMACILSSARAQTGAWDQNLLGVSQTTTSYDVGIGTTSPATKLHLNNGDFLISKNGTGNFLVTQDGLIRGREILIDLDPIPDYVFSPSYKRMSLYELEQYIKTNSHLPNVPGEDEYCTRGAVSVGELQMKLLEKVEELTLYLIEVKKENDELRKRVETLECNK